MLGNKFEKMYYLNKNIVREINKKKYYFKKQQLNNKRLLCRHKIQSKIKINMQKYK